MSCTGPQSERRFHLKKRKNMTQPSLDHSVAAEKEGKLLIGVAAGLGCALFLCTLLSIIAIVAALIWTLQGQLGPG